MLYRKSRRNVTRNRSERNRRNRSDRSNRNRSNRSNRNRSNRTIMGGMAPLDDTSMNMPMKDSLAQGTQYLNIHKGQYGGGMGAYPNAVIQGSIINAAQGGGGIAPYPSSVMASTLPTTMVPAARTGPLDVAIASIQGMQDGGRRNRKTNRNRRASRNRKVNRRASRNRKVNRRASRKTNRNRNASRRNRNHRGGSYGGLHLSPAEVNASTMLLPNGLEKQAGLNYEWSMAKDPSAFLPKA